jgi:transglutaminase-like putative cysteine protease
MLGIRDRMRFDVNATDTGTSAIEAFAHRHGVCQDFAHVFIAAARHLGYPARYVGGYLYQPALSQQQSQGAGQQQMQTTAAQDAGHAWAEALVENLGWVGFDPANGISPTDAYVRVAVGLDYLGAAPVRGTRYGGAGESLSVKVVVHDAGWSGR